MIRLGQRLMQARRQKRVSLEDASKALRIRLEFLQALENAHYDKLPSSAYAVGFVSNYAEYLGLSKQETVSMFRREFDEKRVYKVLPEEFAKTKEFKVKRFHFQQTLGVLLTICACMIFYLLFQYKAAFFSPFLEVSSPKENQIILANEILVTGKTDQNATVVVNNRPVSVGSDGSFEKKIDLFAGKTLIEITATNRFGKKTVMTRHVEVKTRP